MSYKTSAARERLLGFLVTMRAHAAPFLNEVASIHARAMTIPGWINGADARELVRHALALPPNAVVVEVGVFMGRTVALVAGALKKRGGGKVFAVDPFDCTGKDQSGPIYEHELRQSGQPTLEDAFLGHMNRLGLLDQVCIKRGFSSEIAENWTEQIDMLALDADHRLEAARATYYEWIDYLKPGGILILSNTADKVQVIGCNGYRALVENELRQGGFEWVRTVHDFTFARKAR